MASPLNRLTGKKPYMWGQEQQDAFSNLKLALTTTPVLALPNSKDLFILDTDASDFAIGVELIQLQEGEERVIAYGSVSLTPEQQRFCTTRKELLAIVRFTKQFSHYLLGREFVVRTDHSSLTWLLNFKNPQGQLARWLEVISQYNMTVTHRPGKNHGNADPLSPIPDKPCPDMKVDIGPTCLPCGGCKYCVRVHHNWSNFTNDIDDIIPLCRKKQEAPTEVYAALCTLFEKNQELSNDFCHSRIYISFTEEDPYVVTETCAEQCLHICSTTSDRDFTEIEYTAEELKEFQTIDPDLGLILPYLRSNEIPTEDEIFIRSKAAKNIG